jgi:AcrR family transcriptional regulator
MATPEPTEPPAVPRSTRTRPAKPPLSEAAIIDVALAVLKTEGLEAVTMRRVAKELDTGAASLYVYVENRDALRALMLDRIGSTITAQPTDPARWREQIRALCLSTLRVLEAHPGIAAVALATIPTGEGALSSAEAMLSYLLAGGVSPQHAAWACDNLWLIITATAVETDLEQAHARTRSPLHRRGAVTVKDEFDITALRERFRSLPADRFPNVSRYAEELTTGEGDERFLFAIDTYLDGLARS